MGTSGNGVPVKQARRHLLKDVRFGTRTLARDEGFTVVVILVLALGIGASSAMFDPGAP